MKTNENAYQFEHSLDHSVEFFSKAGSIFDRKTKNFYDNDEDILDLFQRAWISNKYETFQLLMWVRDCRGGAGNRSGFRKCIKWLSDNDSEWVISNIKLIPEFGRFDDLRSLFGTKCEFVCVDYWLSELLKNNVLAAKWAKRTDTPLYLAYKKMFPCKNMGNFRRFLSKIRKNHIVEHKLCSKNFKEIEYSKIPSLAMARYTNAFNKHDENRFLKFKESLKKGHVKLNSSVLFPHDCLRTSLHGDTEIADIQFDSLPNFINSNKKIMTLCDTSGSMCCNVSGSIEAIDISKSLALYCSYNIDKNNPFYKKFIAFASESKFVDWTDFTFSEAIRNREIFDESCGSTRIDKALDLILNTALFFKLKNDQIPDMLLITSDMQFSSITHDPYKNSIDDSLTVIEQSLNKWEEKGYKKPKIVYWNIDPYDGQPETINSKDIALISGFSPSILKSILKCDNISARGIMEETLKKYKKLIIKP